MLVIIALILGEMIEFDEHIILMFKLWSNGLPTDCLSHTYGKWNILIVNCPWIFLLLLLMLFRHFFVDANFNADKVHRDTVLLPGFFQLHKWNNYCI